MENSLDYSLIDNLEFEGIDHSDIPDYTDAYISSADYDGKPMTEDELDLINQDSDFVHEKLFDYLH